MDSLRGKVALITGGSSGIGKASALAFARAGADVVLAARGREQGLRVRDEIRMLGATATFVQTDVSISGEVEALVTETVRTYGRLDYAFNNAACIREERFLNTADLTEMDFDRAVASNLKSVWLCMKAEITQMLKQSPKGGAIVNTSSVSGLAGVARGSLYAAAKAAIISFTKSAALEYGRDNIRVNALVPGAFQTPMLDDIFDRQSLGNVALRKNVVSDCQAGISLGRIGDPDEAAAAVLWMCSDSASYMTGHSMILDGGTCY